MEPVPYILWLFAVCLYSIYTEPEVPTSKENGCINVGVSG